ncbi:MAG: DHHA1 domain-containing protein, partial [Cyclobacteriaceae bacterium]|nr:DHHA1 domain-containing protein [Cyclobacteriaceae bacterium]
SELLFDLMVEMGETDLIDADIANCLYSGIMTDTGNFKHPNVTPNVFKICGELLSLGADTAFVARSIYDNSSLDKLKLLGFSLKERLVVLPELSAAYITLSSKDLEDFNSQTGDTEGLVNYALSVKGVNLAALFMERKGFVKMSFRSVGDISVNAMARKYFNGGGHKNAAGGQTEDTLEKTLNLFLKVLPEFTMEMNL